MREREKEGERESEIKRDRERRKKLQAPISPSVGSRCHPCIYNIEYT